MNLTFRLKSYEGRPFRFVSIAVSPGFAGKTDADGDEATGALPPTCYINKAVGRFG